MVNSNINKSIQHIRLLSCYLFSIVIHSCTYKLFIVAYVRMYSYIKCTTRKTYHAHKHTLLLIMSIWLVKWLFAARDIFIQYITITTTTKNNHRAIHILYLDTSKTNAKWKKKQTTKIARCLSPRWIFIVTHTSFVYYALCAAATKQHIRKRKKKKTH